MKRIIASSILIGALLVPNLVFANATTVSDKQPVHAYISGESGVSTIISLPVDSQIIKVEDRSVLYVQDNQMIKVQCTNLVSNKNASLIKSSSSETESTQSEFHFYKRDLTTQEVSLLKGNLALASATLTKSDQNMDSMGTILAQLSVKYTKTDVGDETYYHLTSATGSATRKTNEGVIPQSSELYYHGQGTIRKNGVFQSHGDVGFNKTNLPVNITNYALMDSGVDIAPQALGVNYTVNCTRGVSVMVQVPFA